MKDFELLLGECGSSLAEICKCTVYVTDIRYREPVYRVLGERLRGVFPAFTGVVIVALADANQVGPQQPVDHFAEADALLERRSGNGRLRRVSPVAGAFRRSPNSTCRRS